MGLARSRQRNSPSCATPVGVHANWGACLALARARQSNSPTSATPVGVRAEVSVERAAAAAQQQLDMCNQSASTLIGLACRVWRGRGTATNRHVTCATQSASALIGALRLARPRALQQPDVCNLNRRPCLLSAHPTSVSQSILPSTNFESDPQKHISRPFQMHETHENTDAEIIFKSLLQHKKQFQTY